MPPRASEQLKAIHAMMESGHRSVRLERHTLVLWGLAAAFLILVVRLTFTPERFPETMQRVLASNLFIAAILTAVGVIDFRLTRRARRQRDETLSFVQIQLTKIWWLLVGLIVLINLGMNFFGGGYMFYGIVFALMGIAFYVHGLFSQQMLAWIGVLLIGLGLGGVALNLPFVAMEWLAVFVFGLGFPLLALVLQRLPGDAGLAQRLGAMCGWLLLVIAPTGAAYHFSHESVPPEVPAVSLADYQRAVSGGSQVVRLPAGTLVPIAIEVTGDIFDGVGTAVLPVRLSQNLDLSVSNGRPDGLFRVNAEHWKKALYNYRVRDLKLQTTLARERGPEVSVQLNISTHN